MKRVLLCLLTGVVLTGCASNNVPSYKADPTDFMELKQANGKKFAVQKVTMTVGDSDSILCRLAGNVYLPHKMTFSSYIGKALEKALMSTDRLGNENDTKINLDLTQVEFSSISGAWEIAGRLTIDGGNTIEIKSVTEYGTSFDAMSACRNVADAFPNAVTDFIKQVIVHLK